MSCARLLWMLLLCACGAPDERTAAVSALSPAPGKPPAAPAERSPAEDVPRAVAEVGLPQGDTEHGSTPLAAEAAPLAAAAGRGLRFRAPAAAGIPVAGVAQRIDVGHQPLLLDLEDGTRVTAAAGAQLWAFALQKTLLLVSGQVHLTRVVDAERAGTAPARIASLAGVLLPNAGADFVLRVDVRASAATTSYRAQLAVSRGSATWIAPDERSGFKETQLIAGEPLPKPAPGLQWLNGPAGVKGQSARDQRFAALQRLTLSGDLDQQLDAALSEQQALRERGHVLLAQVSPRHAALAKLPAGEPVQRQESSPRAYQRALATHAQRREAQAAQLLMAAERSLLRALVACGALDPSTCAPLQAWAERFATRAANML